MWIHIPTQSLLLERKQIMADVHTMYMNSRASPRGNANANGYLCNSTLSNSNEAKASATAG
jgi:hypothetical protein